jgi:hypothetical protein
MALAECLEHPGNLASLSDFRRLTSQQVADLTQQLDIGRGCGAASGCSTSLRISYVLGRITGLCSHPVRRRADARQQRLPPFRAASVCPSERRGPALPDSLSI